MHFTTSEQIAADAAVSIRTVARDIASGMLRSRLLDRRRVVEAKDAESYIAKRRAAREAADALRAR
jgi:hypothetical protein